MVETVRSGIVGVPIDQVSTEPPALVQDAEHVSVFEVINFYDSGSSASEGSTEPGLKEEVDQLTNMLGLRLSRDVLVKALYCRNTNPVLKRWYRRREKKIQSGKHGKDEWKRYQTWHSAIDENDYSGAMDPLKEQMLADYYRRGERYGENGV